MHLMFHSSHDGSGQACVFLLSLVPVYTETFTAVPLVRRSDQEHRFTAPSRSCGRTFPDRVLQYVFCPAPAVAIEEGISKNDEELVAELSRLSRQEGSLLRSRQQSSEATLPAFLPDSSLGRYLQYVGKQHCHPASRMLSVEFTFYGRRPILVATIVTGTLPQYGMFHFRHQSTLSMMLTGKEVPQCNVPEFLPVDLKTREHGVVRRPSTPRKGRQHSCGPQKNSFGLSTFTGECGW